MFPSKSVIYRLPLGLHLTIFAALSVLLAAGLPYSDALYGIKDAGLRNLGVIYAITVAFLLSISIGRRRSLQEMVLLELNKVRRINHLAKNIVVKQPELQPWYDEVHGCLEKYLEFFRDHDLGHYEESNRLFRRVTYLVYSLPKSQAGSGGDLYGELLGTVGSATEAREYVGNLIAPSVGGFQLGAVLLISLSLGIMSSAASPFNLVSRSGAALANFCTFLVLEILYDYEFMAGKKKREMADQYVLNLQHLVETMPG